MSWFDGSKNRSGVFTINFKFILETLSYVKQHVDRYSVHVLEFRFDWYPSYNFGAQSAVTPEI